MFKRSVILCAALVMVFGWLGLTTAETLEAIQQRLKAQKKAQSAEKRKEKPRAQDPGIKTILDDAIKNCLGWKPLEQGDIGKLSFPYRVIQVVDDENAIIEITYYPYVSYASATQETVWAKMSTKGMADDKKYSTQEFFKVVGTKKYDTPAGTSRTVMMLEPTQNPNAEKEKAAKAMLAQTQAAAEAKTKAAAEQAQAEKEMRIRADTRTWTSSADGKTMKATFVSRIANKVILRRENGTAVKLSVDDLSEADQQWLATRATTAAAWAERKKGTPAGSILEAKKPAVSQDRLPGNYTVTFNGPSSGSMKLELRPDGTFVLKGGGVDEGKWRLDKDVIVMTYGNKAEGNVELKCGDGQTLVGKNVFANGQVYKWVVRPEEGTGAPNVHAK